MSESIQICPPLTLFTSCDVIKRLDPHLLVRFLEFHKDCLTPEATALLAKGSDSGYMDFYSDWAAQFENAGSFGAPLLRALMAIEALASPDNLPLLNNAASTLPPGWLLNHQAPLLQRALSLWLVSKGITGVRFPVIPGLPEIPAEAPKPPVESAVIHSPSLHAATLHAPTLSPSHVTEVTAASPASAPPPLASPLAPAPDFLDHPCTTATLATLNAPTLHAPTLHAPTLSPSHVIEAAAHLAFPIVVATPESDASAFAKLARLSEVEYDHVRRAEAKRLGLRLRTLDHAVDAARVLEDDAAAAAIHLSVVQPWEEPITDAPALFDAVRERVLLYLSLVPGADIVLTLWPPHAHAIAAFNISPRLNLTSIDAGCGKSTAMDLLNVLSPKVLRTDSLKTAVLFRVVDQHQPTLLLDELDTYLHLYPDLIGLLNAGNKLGGCAHRCYGPHVRAFKAFAATALAGIGQLAPTLRDRSIVINMLKAPEGALQARLDERYLEPEKVLGRKIARWVQDNFAAIAACDPVMPRAAYNRLGDKWRPLFAVAQVIGGHWPQLILDAFHALTQNNNSNNHTSSSALIQDIRQIFVQAGATRLFSRTFVEALNALPSRPWSHLLPSNKQNARLTEVRLARYLAPYGIVPKLVRIGPKRGKAYDLADFPDPQSTQALNANSNGNGHNSSTSLPASPGNGSVAQPSTPPPSASGGGNGDHP